MKKHFLSFALCLFFALPLPAGAVENYTLDPSHTNVVWKASHFGFSSPSGKFAEVAGTLKLDAAKPENSQVDVRIKTASLVTGFLKFDEHLKTPDFLNVLKFPEARFTSFKIDRTGKNTAVIHGDLTLLGVTKRIALNAKLNKIGENMFNKYVAGFSLSGTIKRSDFGMRTYLPGISDEVQLDIEVEAIRDAAENH